jgi:hypothetical protein
MEEQLDVFKRNLEVLPLVQMPPGRARARARGARCRVSASGA